MLIELSSDAVGGGGGAGVGGLRLEPEVSAGLVVQGEGDERSATPVPRRGRDERTVVLQVGGGGAVVQVL